MDPKVKVVGSYRSGQEPPGIARAFQAVATAAGNELDRFAGEMAARLEPSFGTVVGQGVMEGLAYALGAFGARFLVACADHGIPPEHREELVGDTIERARSFMFEEADRIVARRAGRSPGVEPS